MKQRNAKKSTLTQNWADGHLYEVKDISLRKETCKKFPITECKYISMNWRIIPAGQKEGSAFLKGNI